MIWKMLLTHIFKKSDILDPENFWPVSITTAFSKIYEKILHKQITVHLNQYKFFNSPIRFQ